MNTTTSATERPSRVGRHIVGLALAAALVLTGCASTPEAVEQVPVTAPGATLSPAGDDSEDAVPQGLRIVAITTGAVAVPVSTAMADWARATDSVVQQIPSAADRVDADLLAALDEAPDLIVAAGAEVVDLIAFQSPQYLDQPFLLVGGQLAEPTANVTAVIWPGADFRGAGGDDLAGLDPATFTTERITQALDAGTRTVLDGSDGYVLDLS